MEQNKKRSRGVGAKPQENCKDSPKSIRQMQEVFANNKKAIIWVKCQQNRHLDLQTKLTKAGFGLPMNAAANHKNYIICNKYEFEWFCGVDDLLH